MADNLILSVIENLSPTPDTLVLSKVVKTYISTQEVKARIYYRYADLSTEFAFLGEVPQGQTLEVPVELKGKQIILSMIPQTGPNLAVVDPRKGKQTTFAPNAEAILQHDLVKVASEDLAAGDLIHIWDDGGTAKARKADASAGYEAHAWVRDAVTSGNEVFAIFGGYTNLYSGLTAGVQYLSATGGSFSDVAPTTTGYLQQKIGVAVSATQIQFSFQQAITLA